VRARFHLRGRAGRNSFRLALARLAPGHYTVSVSAAVPGGVASRPIAVRIAVVR
jgi:hypothetical protein